MTDETPSPDASSATPPSEPETDDVSLDDIGHPKGTLAILVVYALLFILGWIGLWAFEFLPRGAPH